MPTRRDVDLARAAIDRGFLTIKESVKCLEIQRDYEQAGQLVPLERIFIEADYLSKRQLHLLDDSMAKAEALRHVGNYEILSKVGAGGMGTVYQAKDKKADRIVALKILSPAHASNKEYIQRFLSEAHSSGRLSHPNIVQGYDAGESNGQYYFAMEFVDGVTVGSMLKDKQPVPEQQALDIAIQVSKALEHAEENNLIHRDIKPDNIMIMKDGAAKLADLGLARLTKGDPGAQEQSILGTPYYASPEQCQGADELDAKTDMYSFGCTLFHMLAGRVPFDDDTPEEIMGRHIHDKRPYLKDKNVQLSHGISKIVRKLMAVNKRDRYPSMMGVTTDLTLVRMGRSPRLGKRSRYDTGDHRYRSETGSWRTRPVGRHKTIIQISVCVCAGIVILVGLFFLFRHLSGSKASGDKPPADTNAVKSGQRSTTQEAHEIYLANIIRERKALGDTLFAEKLHTVAEKYPDTSSAKEAEALAAKISKKIDAEARVRFDKMKASASKLRKGQRYQEAIDKVADLPKKYKNSPAYDEVPELRLAIEREARKEFAKIVAAAARLEAEKKFDDAIALYRLVEAKFGIVELKDKAREAIKELEEAGVAEQGRSAEAAASRKAAESKRIRQEYLAIQSALEDTRRLVGKDGAFGAAAARMKTALHEITSADRKSAVGRAVSDLIELDGLFRSLRKAEASLKGKSVSVVRKNGVRLDGTIFRVNDKGISLRAGESAFRNMAWRNASIGSIKMLAKLSGNKRLSPGQMRALATLCYFSGKSGGAKSELNALAANPAEKRAAELRIKDIDLFDKVLAEKLPEM